MLYQKRIVKAPAKGMTREAAVDSIRSSTQFADGTEILDIKRRGDKWVATLLEPHTAEFPPPPDDSEDNGGPPKAEKSESSDSDSDSKGPPDGDKGPKPPEGDKGPSGEMAMMMDLMMAIADKLGVVPGAAAPGAEDSPMPGEVPPPPPGPPGPSAGGPAGGPPGHQEIVHKTKLKPGDTPPGVTPIGAPAFASTNQLSRMASFDAFDDTPGKSIKQAKDELEAIYGPHGFKVRQIKRVEGGTRLAAKLSRR
jgi:hypothetical protein